MLDFDEKKGASRQQQRGCVDSRRRNRSDDLRKGYSNIFYIGIGGTVLYAGQMMHIIKQLGARCPSIWKTPLISPEGKLFMNKDSVVVIESRSPATPRRSWRPLRRRRPSARAWWAMLKRRIPFWPTCAITSSNQRRGLLLLVHGHAALFEKTQASSTRMTNFLPKSKTCRKTWCRSTRTLTLQTRSCLRRKVLRRAPYLPDRLRQSGRLGNLPRNVYN